MELWLILTIVVYIVSGSAILVLGVRDGLLVFVIGLLTMRNGRKRMGRKPTQGKGNDNG